jgi:hypothetical protein
VKVGSSVSDPKADDPDDATPITISVGNNSSVSVSVNVRGTAHTIEPGGSFSVSVAPLHHAETITAAPTSKPGDRFVLTASMSPGTAHGLTVRSMDIGTCNQSGVRQTVYLREDNYNG